MLCCCRSCCRNNCQFTILIYIQTFKRTHTIEYRRWCRLEKLTLIFKLWVPHIRAWVSCITNFNIQPFDIVSKQQKHQQQQQLQQQMLNDVQSEHENCAKPCHEYELWKMQLQLLHYNNAIGAYNVVNEHWVCDKAQPSLSLHHRRLNLSVVNVKNVSHFQDFQVFRWLFFISRQILIIIWAGFTRKITLYFKLFSKCLKAKRSLVDFIRAR